MKNRYIQFYEKMNDNSIVFVEKNGADSVLKLDGRLSLGSCISLAITYCKKNNIEAFRIMKNGGTYWEKMLTDLYKVSDNYVEC